MGFRSAPFAIKSFLTFWDVKGPTLEHYQDKEQTVNSATYSAMLRDRPKPAICNKRRGLLPKNAFLHHDDARPCVMVTTVETIQNLKFEVLSHPPYSPDIIPCDFHALSPLREALHCQWFGCDEEVKGLGNNLKPSSLMESGSSQTATKALWNCLEMG